MLWIEGGAVLVASLMVADCARSTDGAAIAADAPAITVRKRRRSMEGLQEDGLTR
jgi:hypothetical protein